MAEPRLRTPGQLAQHGIYRIGKTRFWAEGGMICLEDEETGAYQSITRRQAILRTMAIADVIRTSLCGDDPCKQRDHVYRYQRDVEALTALIKKAKEQGDPCKADVNRIQARSLPVSVPVEQQLFSEEKIKPRKLLTTSQAAPAKPKKLILDPYAK